MDPIQRYKLILPILQKEKSVKQVHKETNVPVRSIYRYLRHFREGDGKLESLADKSHAAHSHPNWFAQKDKDKVVQYKLRHPHKSSRQLAVDMASEGVYVCGTAHGPKLISESLSQAMAAAARAATFLSQSEITLSVVTAKVDQERCASCLICARVCPYGVPRINKDGVSEIDEALCRGCGICAAECPAKVIQLNWYEDDQVMSKVDALLEGVL